MPLQNLPNWFQTIMFLLACNAGMVNVLSLITVLHQSISHMTGNVSFMALAIINSDHQHFWHLLAVVVFYVLGALCCGAILGRNHFAMNRSYGIPLSCICMLLLCAWWLLPNQAHWGLLWASMAMGMQNAMVSHYKGSIVRTTHLSGVLTDIGLALGYRLRGLQLQSRRLMLHSVIVAGFLLGGLIAAGLYPIFQHHSFLIPALLTFLLSVGYWLLYLRYN